MVHPSVSLPTLGFAEAVAIVGEPVYNITQIGQGQRSRVYRVETEDGAVRIVRLTPKGSGRLAREAWVRTVLRRHPDVPLHAEVAAHEPTLTAAADVVSMAELPGTTMFAAVRTMFEPEVQALYTQFGAGLGAIHSAPVQGFGLVDAGGRGPYPSWPVAFDALAAAALEEARVSPLAAEVTDAQAAIAAMRPAVESVAAPQLLHGDAQLMNVQVHRGRITAFFDFEFAMGGDPVYELAAVEALFEPASGSGADAADLAARRAAFYAGYARHRPTPGDDAAERVRLYRLVHALRGTEFLSVMGPQLAAPVREQATLALRANVRRWVAP